MAEIDTPGDNMLGDPSSGTAGTGTEQEDERCSIIRVGLEVDRPLPPRPTSSAPTELLDNASLGQPLMNFVRCTLDGPSSKSEPQVRDSHGNLREVQH